MIKICEIHEVPYLNYCWFCAEIEKEEARNNTLTCDLKDGEFTNGRREDG